MEKLKFVEFPKKLKANELDSIFGGTMSCDDYSGGCLSFDDCTNNFTGSCSIYDKDLYPPKKEDLLLS